MIKYFRSYCYVFCSFQGILFSGWTHWILSSQVILFLSSTLQVRKDLCKGQEHIHNLMKLLLLLIHLDDHQIYFSLGMKSSLKVSFGLPLLDLFLCLGYLCLAFSQYRCQVLKYDHTLKLLLVHFMHILYIIIINIIYNYYRIRCFKRH